MAEQPTATSDGGLQAKVAALEEERRLFMTSFTKLAEAGNMPKGDWIRPLYQVAFSHGYGGTGAGRATTGEVDRLIDALDRQPMDGEEDQRKAVLRALVEGQGITGLKVAITALFADSPARDAILLVCDTSDTTMLKRLLHLEESTATPEQLNSAISSLDKAARTHGGEVAKNAAGVLTLDKVINGPGGLNGKIHRIAALVAGGGHVPERIPAPAGTSRPAAGGLQQPGPAGATRAAAAPTSRGEGSSAAAAALMSMAPLAPPQDQAPTPVAATGPGQQGPVAPDDDIVLADAEEDDEGSRLVLEGHVADEDKRGDSTSGEPPEPDVLTADYFMQLISHLKVGGKDKEMTLKSGFFIQVRRRARDWSVKVVPRYEGLNSKKQRQLNSDDPRCLTNEDEIRMYLGPSP